MLILVHLFSYPPSPFPPPPALSRLLEPAVVCLSLVPACENLIIMNYSFNGAASRQLIHFLNTTTAD